MTLQQLDDVLKTWQGRLSAMAENLLQLQAEANFGSLTGEGAQPRVALSGLTKARVGPAIATFHQLFLCFGAIESTVEQAASLRRELPALFGADAKAREIQRLLFRPSIQLDLASDAIADRGLLDEAGAPRRCTLDEAMERMGMLYATVRASVSAAGEAWTNFGEAVDRAEAEVRRLRQQTVVPSALLAAALDAVEAQLPPLTDEARTDPLGALARLGTEIEPALSRVAAQMEHGASLAVQLRAAQAQCEELRAAVVRLAALLQRREALIAPGNGAAALPLSTPGRLEVSVDALSQWHRRLEAKREEGSFDAVAIGLRNWTAAASKLHAESREAVTRCEGELALRDELRGRLRALKAKARAHAESAPPDLLALGAEVEDLLAVEPVALVAAAAALTRFEDRLRASSAHLAPAGAGSR